MNRWYSSRTHWSPSVPRTRGDEPSLDPELADFLALQAEARYGPRRYRNLPPVATETMAESDAAEARNRGDVNPRDTDKDARTW